MYILLTGKTSLKNKQTKKISPLQPTLHTICPDQLTQVLLSGFSLYITILWGLPSF